jgi:hypothetical protein
LVHYIVGGVRLGASHVHEGEAIAVVGGVDASVAFEDALDAEETLGVNLGAKDWEGEAY